MSRPAPENEAELLRQLRRSDMKAFETLFRHYHKPLRYFAREFLKDEDEAEDTIQQLFVTIWERRGDLLISGPFKSYLYTAVRNACLKKLDKQKRSDVFQWDEETETAGMDTTAMHIQEKDLSKAIEKAIAALPERCQLVFRLSRFGEMSYQEIANELEISIKTVENQISKALATLRISLKDYFLWALSALFPFL